MGSRRRRRPFSGGRGSWWGFDDIGDEYDGPIHFDAPPTPFKGKPCLDAEIEMLFNIKPGTKRNQLQGFDKYFQGAKGKVLRAAIEKAASEMSVSPGLLAVNALTENEKVDLYIGKGPVESFQIGLDYWDKQRAKVSNRVGKAFNSWIMITCSQPCVAPLKSNTVCKGKDGACHFINENGNDTGRIHVFPTGAEALRAMGGMLKYNELKLVDEVGIGAWNKLPQAVRDALVRLAYNPGKMNPKTLAKKAVEAQKKGQSLSKSILQRTGSIGPHHPWRTATVRAGQMLHLNIQIFGEMIPCPT